MGKEDSAQKTINTIRRKARRKYSAEEKIRRKLRGLTDKAFNPWYRLTSNLTVQDGYCMAK
jgi:hypothetical protein